MGPKTPYQASKANPIQKCGDIIMTSPWANAHSKGDFNTSTKEVYDANMNVQIYLDIEQLINQHHPSNHKKGMNDVRVHGGPNFALGTLGVKSKVKKKSAIGTLHFALSPRLGSSSLTRRYKINIRICRGQFNCNCDDNDCVAPFQWCLGITCQAHSPTFQSSCKCMHDRTLWVHHGEFYQVPVLVPLVSRRTQMCSLKAKYSGYLNKDFPWIPQFTHK